MNVRHGTPKRLALDLSGQRSVWPFGAKLQAPPTRHSTLPVGLFVWAMSVVLLGGGCRGTGPSLIQLQVRAASDVQDHGMLGQLSAAASTGSVSGVALDGAGNETLGFWLAVTPGPQPVKVPDFHVGSLQGVGTSIDAAHISLFRVHPVALAGWPGWHIRSIPPSARDASPLDVLVPLRAPRGGLPGVLKAGQTYVFWVDVAIPADALDGVYNGEIEISSQGRPMATAAIQLTVWPFVLPQRSDFVLLAPLDHRALFRHHVQRAGRPYCPLSDDWRQDADVERLDALLLRTVRMLRRFGLTPVLPRLLPEGDLSGRGDVALDWTAYDRTVGGLLEGTAFEHGEPLAAWPLPIEPFLAGRQAGRSGSGHKASRWQSRFVRACADHFEDRGWLDRAYVLPLANDLYDGPTFLEINNLLCSLRDLDARIPLASPYFPQDPIPFGWASYAPDVLCEGVDIWAPAAQHFDPAAMARQRKAGRRVWMRSDRPPFSGTPSIYGPASCRAALGWQAYAHGVEVVPLGGVNDWPAAGTHPTPADCLTADPAALIFPGGPFGLDGPVASLRLVQLRRALDTGALRTLLRKNGLGHIPEALAPALGGAVGTTAYATHFADGKAAGWPADDRVFARARRLMLDALLQKLNHPWFRDPRAQARRSLQWRRFMDGVRTVSMQPLGAKIRVPANPRSTGLRIEASILIENHSRANVAGTLRWVDHPVPWTAPPAYPVKELLPGASRRVVLSLETDRIPQGSDGLLFPAVEFRTLGGVAYRTPVRIASVMAERADTPPRIDGYLDDWPIVVGNAAGGFSLISGPPGCARGEASCQPKAATQVFVRGDEDHLYVAFRCTGLSGPSIGGNEVVYDDMIPTGGDLVEVLIDPLNGVTRTPSDLYHIAIKPSGTVLTEKGISLKPACGTHEPWPVQLRYAVKANPDGYNVEMAIPIRSLAQGKRGVATWGINFCRYDAVHQEYATWSGAVGNSYDPLSLGTLIWALPHGDSR